ncbi:MAG: hypothetical protein KDA94_16520, partial [Acidimicrobiales bacterium]|nr:hypothetical protein [Acidimicrobiales bacterium]
RDGASGWRPRGHDTGDPTDAPAHRRRPSPLARAVVAVVLIGALAATIQIRRDRGDDASEAMPAALAGQPEVGRMQAEEGAAFDAMVPDRQLGWVLPQSSPGKLVAVEHGHRRTLANGDAGPVVWIFGGSAAWGSGQRDGHTIAAELSRLAAASRRPIRVVNFGVFAYTAAQEAAAFERATNEHDPPNLVIFYDGYNDVEVSMVGQLEGLPAGSEAVAPLTVLRGSRVLHREEGQPATTTDGRVAGVIAAYARAMSAARSTAQAHGVEVVQVWQPNAFTRDLTAMERQDLEDRGYSADIVSAHAELHAKIRAALPAEVIDLSDALDDAPTVYLDPVHTSERGAAIVAAALYRQINSTLDHLGR